MSTGMENFLFGSFETKMEEMRKVNTEKVKGLLLKERPIARINYKNLKRYLNQFEAGDSAIVYSEKGMLDFWIEKTSKIMSCTEFPEYVIALSGYMNLDHYYEPLMRVIVDSENETAIPVFFLNDIIGFRIDCTDTFDAAGVMRLEYMLHNLCMSINERIGSFIKPTKHIKE